MVVVDGGSEDDTIAIARAHADLALLAPRGRASQMNAGAAACPADVLLFLHADTTLPENADLLVRRAASAPAHGADSTCASRARGACSASSVR